MSDERMTYVVRADDRKVGTTATRPMAILMMASHACNGREVDLVSGRTGRRLSFVDLPCVCGRHERKTVVQRG